MTQPSPPPGWYPDPSGAAGQRYWDGRQWTIHAPTPHPAQPSVIVNNTVGYPARGVRGFIAMHPILTALAALMVIGWIVAVWRATLVVAIAMMVAAAVMVIAHRVKRSRIEQAEIAGRADSQNEAFLRGDLTWGLFGLGRQPTVAPTRRNTALIIVLATSAVLLMLGLLGALANTQAPPPAQTTVIPTVPAVPPPTVAPLPQIPVPIPIPSQAHQ